MSDSWLLAEPAEAPIAQILLAHGAGSPMDSDWMNQVTAMLVESGVRVVRFEFDYMHRRREDGTKRPPSKQDKLLIEFQEQLEAARQAFPGLPWFVGGKSMGGRVATHLACADADLCGVLCWGYPFHPAGKPDTLRIEHLPQLKSPCCMLQGTRDALGSQEDVAGYDLPESLGFVWFDDGDHDLKPRKASGFTQEQHLAASTVCAAAFMQAFG